MWTSVDRARSIRVIESAWPRIEPTLAMSATSLLTLRKRTARPVGGVGTTESKASWPDHADCPSCAPPPHRPCR